MKNNLTLITLAVALQVIVAPALAQPANLPTVPRWSVVPIKFDDQLSIRDNEVGDSFSATVTDDNGLFPRRTRLDGHVENIHYGNRYRPPSMDLRFDVAVLPDGVRENLDAVPVPLNAKFVHRGRDGRLYADQAAMSGRGYVAAGTIGGLVVGGLFNRPILGAFLGSIAGIFAATAARDNPDNDLVAKKGSKAGALFEEDAPLGEAPPNQQPTADTVRIRDRVLNFPPDQQPFWANNGDVLMVPLLFTADRFHLQVDTQGDGSIFVRNAGNRIRVRPGSAGFRLDGRGGTMAHPVEERRGLAFVPIELLATVSNDDIFVNDSKVFKLSGRESTVW